MLYYMSIRSITKCSEAVYSGKVINYEEDIVIRVMVERQGWRVDF